MARKLNFFVAVSLISFALEIEANWFSNGSTEYFISSDQAINFSAAIDHCSLLNASLAILSNTEAYTFVTDTLSQISHSDLRFHISAAKEPYKNFTWIGSEDKFPGAARWGPGHPVDEPSNAELCVALVTFIEGRYPDIFGMADGACSSKINFICQRTKGYAWSAWGNWNSCSTTCVEGEQIRKRSCFEINEEGFERCGEETSDTEKRACNTHLCNQTRVLPDNCTELCEEELSTTPSFSQPSPGQQRSYDAIIGGGAGAGALLIIIIVIFSVCYMKRTRKSTKTDRPANTQENEDQGLESVSNLQTSTRDIPPKSTSSNLYESMDVVDEDTNIKPSNKIEMQSSLKLDAPKLGPEPSLNKTEVLQKYTPVKKELNGKKNPRTPVVPYSSSNTKLSPNHYDTFASIRTSSPSSQVNTASYDHVNFGLAAEDEQAYARIHDKQRISLSIQEEDEYNTLEHGKLGF